MLLESAGEISQELHFAYFVSERQPQSSLCLERLLQSITAMLLTYGQLKDSHNICMRASHLLSWDRERDC